MCGFVLAAALCARAAAADPLPAGALGVVFGGMSGTGEDAKRIGGGYYQFGMQASWQPTTTDRKLGWTVRWATMFGTLYGGNAAMIDTSLKTVQMDLTLGARLRPWASTSRYLTLRGGGELMRINEPIPPKNQRAFVGGIASIGLDQYISGFLLSVDVRYGLIAANPSEIALLVGFGITGP